MGIYVIADPTVAARAIQILTPTKGWVGAVYVAKAGAGAVVDRRLDQGGAIPSAKASQRVDLDTAGNRFRYYLVWITKLPPGGEQGRDLGDPPVQVRPAGAEAGGIRSDPARYEDATYLRSCRTACGAWLACASMAVPACCRIWFLVRVTISSAMSTSRMRLSAEVRFSW